MPHVQEYRRRCTAAAFFCAFAGEPAHAFIALNGDGTNGIGLNGIGPNGARLNGGGDNGILRNGGNTNGTGAGLSTFIIDGIELAPAVR